MTNLEDLRKQLNSIDEHIVKLLDKRMQITDQVAEYKNEHNLPLTDPKREGEIIQSLKQHIAHNILKETIEDIYQVIFSTSKTTRGFIKSNEMPFKKVAIIGLGLIGGSVAKALKAKDRSIEISTIKRESENSKLAIEQGYIDHVYETWRNLLENVELVILTSSIESIPALAQEISSAATNLSHKVIVIDAASVKTSIATEFENVTSEVVEFLPTHPMGGSDKTGFDNAKATLFINRPWVITPHQKNTEDSTQKIQEFIQFVGSKPIILTPQEHDEYAAVISHLVFIISTYLFAYPFEKHTKALEIAGSGFESLTRLASGSAAMHEQIVMNNKEYIQKALKEFIEFIQHNELTAENIRGFFENYKKERDEFVKK